jgi:hypothetical protein
MAEVLQKLPVKRSVPCHATVRRPREKDDILDAGVDAVRGVDIGALAAPAPGRGGQVRHPQGVAPAVGLEQGQLRARVRALAAGEDPHRLRPALELIAVRALAQQPGQLRDVRFLDPALAVGDRWFPQASSARRSRTWPFPSIAASQAGSGTWPIAAFSRAAA